MTQVVRAVYENGVLRPLDRLELGERETVRVTVETDTPAAPPDATCSPIDPFEGIKRSTGIVDLAQHFDDYRFGRRRP